MNSAQLFAEQGYLFLPGEVSADICRLASGYALLKRKVAFTPEAPDAQLPGTHSVYADTLMEALLERLHARVEHVAGLQLFPTYSYYRVYGAGDELRRHRDRPSCEISVTVCLGHRYVHDDPEYAWAFYVDAPKGPQGPGTGTKLAMNPGDMTLYRGCDVEHWREPFDARPGSYLVQAFLHYVDQHGPHREYKFDRRRGLGLPPATPNPEQERARALVARAFPERAATLDSEG